jgi:hypothetical protein
MNEMDPGLRNYVKELDSKKPVIFVWGLECFTPAYWEVCHLLSNGSGRMYKGRSFPLCPALVVYKCFDKTTYPTRVGQ